MTLRNLGIQPGDPIIVERHGTQVRATALDATRFQIQVEIEGEDEAVWIPHQAFIGQASDPRQQTDALRMGMIWHGPTQQYLPGDMDTGRIIRAKGHCLHSGVDETTTVDLSGVPVEGWSGGPQCKGA